MNSSNNCYTFKDFINKYKFIDSYAVKICYTLLYCYDVSCEIYYIEDDIKSNNITENQIILLFGRIDYHLDVQNYKYTEHKNIIIRAVDFLKYRFIQ